MISAISCVFMSSPSIQTYHSESSLNDRAVLYTYDQDGYELISNDITYNPGLRQLGQGSYGTVVPVTFQQRPAAYKQFKYSNYESAHSEASLMHCLQHEHIVSLYAVLKTSDTLGLLLELMPGGSMEDLLHYRHHIKYYINHVLSWAHQITKALSFIHSKKYLHRDLKPSNILLSADYLTLKLCDFGTSCTHREKMTNYRGTPVYMAMEVFTGTVYNEKCDIYSFGITLWEMVTRISAKEGLDRSNEFALQWSIYKYDHRPPLINDIPEPLTDLIKRCWHREPEERPCASEAQAILECLQEFYDYDWPLIDLTANIDDWTDPSALFRPEEIKTIGTVDEPATKPKKPKNRILKTMSKCMIM